MDDELPIQGRLNDFYEDDELIAVGMTAEQERAAVVAWLESNALAIKSPVTELPMFRAVLWALSHPFQFARHHSRYMALFEAAQAIEAGEHLPPPPE